MASANTGQTFTSRIAHWSSVHRWLMIADTAIVIPLKALVLNLLSVGAVYGVLMMVLQWG